MDSIKCVFLTGRGTTGLRWPICYIGMTTEPGMMLFVIAQNGQGFFE